MFSKIHPWELLGLEFFHWRKKILLQWLAKNSVPLIDVGLSGLSISWVSFGSLYLSVVGPLHLIVKCVGIELFAVFLDQPFNA